MGQGFVCVCVCFNGISINVNQMYQCFQNKYTNKTLLGNPGLVLPSAASSG